MTYFCQNFGYWGKICELGLCAADSRSVNDQRESCLKWQGGRSE